MGKVLFGVAEGFCICLFESDLSVVVSPAVRTMFVVPVAMNGMHLVAALAVVGDSKGITGTTDVRLTKRRNGTSYDMFTTNIQIGDEWWADNCEIDPAQSEILTGDIIQVDIVAVHETPPEGLALSVTFG